MINIGKAFALVTARLRKMNDPERRFWARVGAFGPTTRAERCHARSYGRRRRGFVRLDVA